MNNYLPGKNGTLFFVTNREDGETYVTKIAKTIGAKRFVADMKVPVPIESTPEEVATEAVYNLGWDDDCYCDSAIPENLIDFYHERFDTLKKCEQVAKTCDDGDLFYSLWRGCGIPDDADDIDYWDIALDVEEYTSVLETYIELTTNPRFYA